VKVCCKIPPSTKVKYPLGGTYLMRTSRFLSLAYVGIGLNTRKQIPIGMSGIAKIYIQGDLKRGESEFYTLLPALLSAGFQKDDVICVPFMRHDELKSSSIFNIYDPFLPRGKLPLLNCKGTHLPLDDLIQICSFTTILQSAAELDLRDDAIIIVLDAKTIPRRDFHGRLKNLVGMTWDCISLAYYPNILKEDASYFADSEICEHDPTSPMSSRAIALRLSYVKKIVKTILPFREPLCHELIFQTLIHNTRAHYVFPPIFDSRLKI
jgi:hypothetical protein